MVIGALIVGYLIEIGPASTAELAEFFGISDRTVRNTISLLKKNKVVSEILDLTDIRRRKYKLSR